MANKEKTITVVAAASQVELERHGADVEQHFDFVKDAKAYARNLMTDEYHRSSEATTRLGYTQVLVDGECAYDFFGHDSESRSREEMRDEQLHPGA
ncbi:MAG TPA: hypothetical protein VNH18_01030 [Bryobacteraceae bacterium]|nr:hypothetical protein [Bryobacteraceae bacterium]